MHKRLPELTYRQPLPEEAERLRRWLAEWEFSREEKESKENSRKPELRAVPPSSARIDETVADYDTSPETLSPGAVRLFSSRLFGDEQRPVYCLVLEEWDDEERLVAVFSPFSEPATTTEYLTGCEEFPLRVLSCWNACTLPLSALQQGWLAARFTPAQLEEARTVFRHAATGEDLPEDLEKRNGPPVIHPLDPRVEYQDEEARLLAPLFLQSLDNEGEEEEEEHSKIILALPAAPPGGGLRDAVPYALAAAEKGSIATPGFLFRGTLTSFLEALNAGIEVAEADKFFAPLLDGPSAGAPVYWDVEASSAGNLQGAVFALIHPEKNAVIGVGEIEDGTAVLPADSLSTPIPERDLDRLLMVVFDAPDA